MTTAIFAVIAAICAIGWLVNWVGNAALVKWPAGLLQQSGRLRDNGDSRYHL